MACCSTLELVQAGFLHDAAALVGWLLEDWREAVVAEELRMERGQLESAQLREWAVNVFLSLNMVGRVGRWWRCVWRSPTLTNIVNTSTCRQHTHE